LIPELLHEDLLIVTWMQNDNKMAVIIDSKYTKTFMSSTIYARGSSTESYQAAIENMLENLQVKVAAIMPSISEQSSTLEFERTGP